MTTDIDRLIDEYVGYVRAFASTMQEHFGSRNLLTDWREGRIPKRGEIGDIVYRFHGVGCTVDTPSCSIDFDFGPDGIVGGFDAFRLATFAKSRPSSDGSIISEDDLRKCLLRLQEQGKVTYPRLDPSPHLLYFASELNENEDYHS